MSLIFKTLREFDPYSLRRYKLSNGSPLPLSILHPTLQCRLLCYIPCYVCEADRQYPSYRTGKGIAILLAKCLQISYHFFNRVKTFKKSHLYFTN